MNSVRLKGDSPMQQNDTVFQLPLTKNPENTTTIEASEIFDMLMRNMFHPKCKELIVTYINKDKRDLSKLTTWLLNTRGFNSEMIPKMAELEDDEGYTPQCA
jgi:hypothetical protein